MGSLRFNQIELVGFKSFVEPTVFEMKPGLTGVVGPNGCGKSNLLEAIRWVMGANSAKAMRGKAMDDVIFSGTKTRPARNQASVTLTIDNTARIAPSMFNDEEILEVSRTITRGAGSKYVVNGKTVRAKDVQLLFADASTGANSPALVRQGQISELIAAKPENRRRILEEAAGISGLHTRRHEAELRLRAAEANLERLEDVLAQIESQLLSLRRQSRQAARFKRIAGEIHEYRALLWLKRWQSALETLSGNEDSLKQAEARVQDLTSTVTRLSTEVAEIAVKLEPLREEQIVAAAICGRLNAAKEALEEDAQAAKTEIGKLEARLKFLHGDIEREQGIITDAETALERLQTELEDLQSAKDVSAALESAQAQAEKAVRQRQNLETQVQDLRTKIAKATASHEAAIRDVERLESQKQRLEADLESAKTALSNLEEEARFGTADNLFAASLERAAKALKDAKEAEQQANLAREQAEREEREHYDILNNIRQKYAEYEAEFKALSALVNTARGEANGTGVLEHIKAEPGYEAALAAALGDDLDASLDTNTPLHWQGAKTPDQALPEGLPVLADFVQAPDELKARLNQIGIVETREGQRLAKSLHPGQRLVSRQGDVWRWDGFVASRDVIPAAAVRLENKNRLAEIERELATLKTQLGEAETRWKEAKDVRQIKQEEARAARAQIPALEEEDRKARAALSAFEMERARRAEQKSALTDRLNRLETEHTAIIAALEEAKARLETCQPDAAAEQEIGELQARLEQARAEADEAGARYLSLKNERDARAARLQSVEQEIRDWQARAAQARQRITSLEGRLSETETALQAANDSPDEFTRRRQKILAELSEAETRRNNASDALVEIETALREAEARLKTAEGDLGQAREARAAAEARLVSAQERKQEIQARIHETLSCEPHELKDKLEDLSPESKMAEHDIERKLERLVRERENLGSVNLRADEEAVEQEERLAAMTDEKQDLLAAIAKLREGIESLNAEGRQRLLDAFDTVNAHFGQLFTTLFGGGHASLNLSESDDPLEAGLEILVSPPGKRLGNMSLMSGGEQALTATALIFAVFLSNPAPICVLDEVDAPLDDANVERYCNLLDEMVKQTETKFIAITHNPVTMARMDRLFGVTMAEQGVSQLLSIDLGTAERLTA